MNKTYTRTARVIPTLGENRRLTFYAAVWNQVTTLKDYAEPYDRTVQFREVVRPGAFDEYLKDGNNEVIANIDHDPAKTFAKRSDGSLVIHPDPHGLFCTCWVPETPEGDAIIAGVKSGFLDGCSFRFRRNDKMRWSEEGDMPFCELLGLHLDDVCLTHYPAYKGTEAHVRSDMKLRSQMSRLKLARIRNTALNKKS